MTIGAEQGDAITALDSRCEKCAGQLASAIGELRVGVALLAADHRCSAGILPLRITDKAQRGKWNIHCEPRLSLGGLPSVDDECVSGYKVRCIGREENSSALQILGSAETSQRNARQQICFVSLDYFFRHVRGKPAGRDGVDLNVVHAPLTG